MSVINYLIKKEGIYWAKRQDMSMEWLTIIIHTKRQSEQNKRNEATCMTISMRQNWMAVASIVSVCDCTMVNWDVAHTAPIEQPQKIQFNVAFIYACNLHTECEMAISLWILTSLINWKIHKKISAIISSNVWIFQIHN